MKTASSLALIAIGAILAFAVTANTSVFNLHIAGVVIILTGLAGLFIPGKGYGWLRRRVIIPPRARARRAGAVVEETKFPPYVVRNPGTARRQAGLPDSPFFEPDPDRAERAHHEPLSLPSAGRIGAADMGTPARLLAASPSGRSLEKLVAALPQLLPGCAAATATRWRDGKAVEMGASGRDVARWMVAVAEMARIFGQPEPGPRRQRA